MKRKLVLIACLIVGMLLLSACGLFPKKEKQPAEEVTVTVSTPEPTPTPAPDAGTDTDTDTGADPNADTGCNARADAHPHHPVGHDCDDESAGGNQEPYG